MAIKESELTTYSTIATSDYVRSVTSSGASRKTLASDLAKTIVEQYISSDLAGSNRSIKSAIDSIGNDIDTINEDIDTITGDVSTINGNIEIDAEVIEIYEDLGWANS